MRYFIISIFSIVLFVSCTSDETLSYKVGSDFIETDIQVRLIDTFSIKAGTYKLDSLPTSNTSRILLGSLFDNYFGHLTAKSYLQLSPSSLSIDAEAVYDSIGMILNYDNYYYYYYYGDTTKIQSYNIYRVTQTIEPEEGTTFYNTSTLHYDPASLGELSFTPKPNKSTDSLYIPMKVELGEEIFNKIVDNDINTIDDFLQYFKGIAIVPDTTLDSHVLGFNISTIESTARNSKVRLYYTVNDDDDNENNSYYVDFVLSDATKQFNEIRSDLSSTILDSFEDVEDIKLSTSTDNLIFAQGGTGISSRIEIPSIKKLSEISNTSSVLSAELTFKPLNGSYSNSNSLDETLLVYVVDHKNRVIKELVDIDGNVVNAVLNQDGSEFNSNTYYSINLSGYVEEILQSEYDLNYALMIQFTNYSSIVKNLVIDNDANNQIKLAVKYLNY
ncbi:DUF4270 domain-containing protein [Polaribacter sp. MSW13]|uniref:DUF4270 domain-containing protein n=1 Tax=Polaribacter marinus TaxID=2916838 RepID=A0A9X1VLD4_9FLAO|nr:DUF4270 family protein [Polaribacter marinus]MCI2227708.1 DUF4270 domain-containing protein [Polaribacter marinus]